MNLHPAKIGFACTTGWERITAVEFQCDDKHITLDMNPDTGAQVNVMPRKIAENIGLKIPHLNLTDVELVTFSGNRCTPDGYFWAKIRVVNGLWRTTKFYVDPGASETLLCGEDAEALGIVNFPLHAQHSSVTHVNAYTANTAIQATGENCIREQLLQEYADVFDQAAPEILKPMEGPPMRIHLRDDAVPYALTSPRPVAFSMREAVKAKLEDLVRQDIIERVGDEASPWCHPMIAVKTKSGGVRICVDLTRLNRYVQRPVYPMRTPKDAVDAIKPTDVLFTKLDASQGYYQLPLAEEDRNLTCFITPEGRFRFKRAPMGLNASGDEFCRRGDIALESIKNVEKVVDDILIHTGADPQTHETQVREVLERCRKHRITLSAKKFVFAQSSVNFAGYKVTDKGISLDEDKISAIRNFPRPTNITQMRAFLGMANQFTSFTKELSEAATPLRALLRKEASTNFVWTPEADAAFEKVKEFLSSPPLLQPFDPSPAFLHTDASRSGLGFALIQLREDGTQAIIQLGSRFTTETESRYAITELEMLAAVWAVTKCRLYLSGNSFTIVVDHRPLLALLGSKSLDAIDNPRLLRLRQKLLPYTFEEQWCQGKLHSIPDAFSRYPTSQPSEEDHELENEMTTAMEIRVNVVIADLRHDDATNNTRDFMLENLEKEARSDPRYMELTKLISTSSFPQSASHLAPDLKPFFKLRNNLSVKGDLALYDGAIIIPPSERPAMLKRLHAAHQGIERTRRRARGNIFWPGISSDIKNVVDGCHLCQNDRPSLAAETTSVDAPPTRPFQEVCADFFEYGGHTYSVYTCRYSGWIEIHRFEKPPTATSMINVIRRYFTTWGIPMKFRSDGGPQFASRAMRDFLKHWGVNQVFSAPYFPSSNGIAEAAVRCAKHIVSTVGYQKTAMDTDDWAQALLEWRNTPRVYGKSPAELVFGRPIRSCVPSLAAQPEALPQDIPLYPSRKSGRDLQPLPIGSPVWIQNPESRRWDSAGVVTERQDRNYLIELENGRTALRNRRHVRERRTSLRRPPLKPRNMKHVTFLETPKRGM